MPYRQAVAAVQLPVRGVNVLTLDDILTTLVERRSRGVRRDENIITGRKKRGLPPCSIAVYPHQGQFESHLAKEKA